MQTNQPQSYLAKPVPITEQHWEDGTVPLVSISCITYNHEKYICAAIEGFLMQETTFPVEILIHDDASTDGTANIVREYQQKHPGLIFPIYQTENQHSKGIRISATFQFPRARGKYIALCEGDDYWTDSLKLQKQVDILEENDEYIACFTNAVFSNEIENTSSTYVTFLEEGVVSLTDIIRMGGYIFPTCTFVFRKQIIENRKFDILDKLSGDTKLIISAALQGKVFFLNQETAVYRRWSGGLYSRVALRPDRIAEWKMREIRDYKHLQKIVNLEWVEPIKEKISSESLYILRNSNSIKRFLYVLNLTRADTKALVKDCLKRPKVRS